MLKKQIARLLVRSQLRRLLEHADPFNRLVGEAARLQFGETGEESFRNKLELFYANLRLDEFKRDFDFAAKTRQLNRPGGYKIDILTVREAPGTNAQHGCFNPWGRRFGLLRRMGIRSDILIV